MFRATRLTLLCHGETTASRKIGFAADEPLAVSEAEKAAGLAAFVGRPERIICSPAQAAQQTARALLLPHVVDPVFRDLDYGRWGGRTLADVGEVEAEALDAWAGDASAAPHGGESIISLTERMRGWMAENIQIGGHHLIVTHAAVIRAMILVALDAPPNSFWKIDIEHLSITDLRSDGRRWAIRSLGRGSLPL